MAFFARLGKSDFDEYSAFHVKCGSVKFSNGRRTVAHDSIGNSVSIAFSSEPIPRGGMFQVKVVDRKHFSLVSNLLKAIYSNLTDKHSDL